jgi:DNA-binding transcriptional regulator GbsR (MarR family)
VVPQPDPLLDYTERFAAVLIAAGFPPMPARVFVALLIDDSGRLSAADLAERLQISPAAVSGAVHYLMQLGMVHKIRVPGSRRDYYQMPDGVWQEMFSMRGAVMERWAALLREGLAMLPGDSQGRVRLADHADFIDFATKEMAGVVARWEEHRNNPRA